MHKNIIILGLVSLFTDISSEMIYPLVPLYLTAVMGASPAVIGIIEGVAESLASLLKIVSGSISDRLGKRKPLTIIGYGLSGASKLLFIMATNWTGILAARASDRFGKGIRTAPRDALIAESSNSESRGKSFGLHKAMDTAGAVVGIVLAYWLFTHYQGDYLIVFWLSVIPAVIGILFLFTVHDIAKSSPVNSEQIRFSWKNLDRRLQYFLAISFLFNLGNSSNQFLLVKAGYAGFSPQAVILLYLLMNITYFLISYPAGRLSDRIGRRVVLVFGYLLYGLVYMGFALAVNAVSVILLFGIYGLYTGLTQGVEKAFLADVASKHQRASIYGLHALVVGVTLLPASVIAGLLWDVYGADAPFWFGGFTGIVSAAAIWLGIAKR